MATLEVPLLRGTESASREASFSAAAIRTDAELMTLEREWKQLFNRSADGNIFLSFEWMSNWWFQFGQDRKLLVITVRDVAGQLAGLAPLYISENRGLVRMRRLGFLGDDLVGSDYLDVLANGPDAPALLQCLATFILQHKSEWDYIELLDTLRNSQTGSHLLRHLTADDDLRVQVTPSSICPYLSLPESAEAFRASRGRKTRKHLKYYLRALQREGAVEFVTARSGPEIEAAFEELIRLHRARFGTSAFLDRRVGSFHRAALEAASDSGWTRIHLLKFKGKCIAALYALSAGRKIFFYQSGINPDYSRFSVGSIMIAFAIEDAISNGCREFDFLRGDEAYKFQWTKSTRQMQSIHVFDGRGKSRIAFARRTLRTSLHNFKVALSSVAKRFQQSRRRSRPRIAAVNPS